MGSAHPAVERVAPADRGEQRPGSVGALLADHGRIIKSKPAMAGDDEWRDLLLGEFSAKAVTE